MAPAPHPTAGRRRWLHTAGLLVLPLLSAIGVSWGVAMDPKHGTDLHTYQEVARALLRGAPFYTSAIGGQFFLSPVGALGTLATLPVSHTWLHLGWGMLCAVAVLILLRRVGVRGVALALLAAVVIAVLPGRTAITQGRVTVLLMAAVVLDLLDWPRRPRWLPRGVLTGLGTAGWPFLWPFLAVLVLRRRRAGIVGILTLTAATVLTGILLPRMTLVYWTQVLPGRFTFRDSTVAGTNHAVLAATLRILGPPGQVPGIALMALAGAAAIVAAVWWDRAGRPWMCVAMAAVAMLVAAPLVPDADLVWVLLLVAAVAVAEFRRGPGRAPLPVGLTLAVMVLVAWILADPVQALPRGVPVTRFTAAELAVSAGVPVLALVTVVVGLIEARLALRTPGPAEPAAHRFWNHRITLLVGTLVLGIGAAVWRAGITDDDVSALVRWDPQLADFAVYVRAARAFLDQQPLYATAGGQWPFLYPPFAAILAVPLGLLPLGLVQFAWLALSAVALLALLYRLGLRGWHVAFAAIVCIALAGPIRSTFALGQVSILLLVMCLLDLMPSPGLTVSVLRRSPRTARLLAGRDRLVPAGVLIGIATAIKLTPGLFIALLWFTGRRRAAGIATATATAATLLGFVVSPRQSVYYWTQIALGRLEFAPDPRGWLHNQALVSAWQRFVGLDHRLTVAGLALGTVFTGLGLLAAVVWVRRGHLVFGASLCGLASLFVLPVAWNHYFVWALPLGVALLRPDRPEALAPVRIPPLLRMAGLVTVIWLLTEPFWILTYAGGEPLEFVRWNWGEKLIGSAGALLMMATVILAIMPVAEARSTFRLSARDRRCTHGGP